MDVPKVTGEIVKQVLIHVCQYGESDAEDSYKDEEGSELWEGITQILNKESPNG